MDCADALDWMEAAELGAVDQAEPELGEARTHVSGCANCQSAWPQRRAWAGSLSQAMSAVEIPPGLQARLLANIPTAAASEPSVAKSRAPRFFPRFLTGVAAAAVLLLVTTFAQLWWPSSQQLALADLYPAASAEVSSLPEFRGRFVPRLPLAWTSSFSLDPSLVRGFPGAGVSAGNVALIPFQLTARGDQAPLRGRLLMLPRAELLIPVAPATTTGSALRRATEVSLPEEFAASEVRYIPGNQGAFLMWAEDDLVFVCVVSSGPADLHRLHELLSRSRSLI